MAESVFWQNFRLFLINDIDANRGRVSDFRFYLEAVIEFALGCGRGFVSGALGF